MEIIKIIILSLSGLLLSFVGIMRLINPIKTYFKNSGIQLQKDVNLLNEMRGVSTVMLCGGIISFLGIIFPTLTFTSLLVIAVIFLGFATGRFISIMMDGKPNQQLMQGIVFEVILGVVTIFLLLN